jgi:hypothetical protein
MVLRSTIVKLTQYRGCSTLGLNPLSYTVLYALMSRNFCHVATHCLMAVASLAWKETLLLWFKSACSSSLQYLPMRTYFAFVGGFRAILVSVILKLMSPVSQRRRMIQWVPKSMVETRLSAYNPVHQHIEYWVRPP